MKFKHGVVNEMVQRDGLTFLPQHGADNLQKVAVILFVELSNNLSYISFGNVIYVAYTASISHCNVN
jgi:hypothetical protein